MSDDEREEKELDLSSPEVVTKYKLAAETVNKALQLVLSECKPNAKIVDICEKGDSFIREQTGNMYKNVKKKIEKGIAFPTCLSVNNTLCHFSPLASDESVLEEGDVLKIDMGCHIDGFIAVVAHTHVLHEGKVTGKAADVIAAANTAAEVALRLVRPGKKLSLASYGFVGDSLQRGQWQSFVCLVESIIPEGQKSMRRGRAHSVFRVKEYNATVEFYWAPFLVESNSDLKIIGDPKQRILRVDSVAKHAKHWLEVDILVFNTYVWWMSGLKIKSLWGSFANGEEGYEELDAPVSYRIGLKTWANWVDSTIDTNKTRVFFTTMSPTHQRSADWNNKGGIKCYNETKPVMKKGHWGTGSDKRIMKVVLDVVEKMKVPVTVINITQLSEYRVDAHASVYTETQGNLLTDEQKADPLHNADCIHWCLPGVPDAWNQIFFAHLL